MYVYEKFLKNCDGSIQLIKCIIIILPVSVYETVQLARGIQLSVFLQTRIASVHMQEEVSVCCRTMVIAE